MIQFLLNTLTKVGITRQQDKVLHLIVGFLAAAPVMLFFGEWAALAVGFTIGVAKEVYDVTYKAMYKATLPYSVAKQRFDTRDIFATVVGAAVAVMLIGATV